VAENPKIPENQKQLDKKKEREKRLNEIKARKAAAAKKPKRSFFKYFKDARAEFKKVTWPAPKQIVNNTAVVLAMLVVSGLAIWGLDTLFSKIFTLVLNK